MTAYHTARQGQTLVVVLEGEAGIGKTRLATEFLQWTSVQGGDVLRWQGDKLNSRGVDDWLAQQAAAPLLPASVHQLIQSRLNRLSAEATYYQQAKSLSLQSPVSDIHLLLTNLGRAYELAGDLSQATAVYEEMCRQAKRQNQPEFLCQALNRLATVAVHQYEFDTAVAHLQQALKIAAEIGHKQLLAETGWGLAQLYHHQFDFQQSLIHSRQTLTLARELDDLTLTADSLNALAYAHLLLGHVEDGRALMAEARAAYTTLGNKTLEADCLTAIAAAHFWQGQVDAASLAAQTALAICAKIENPWGNIYSRVWLVVALLDKGDYETALAEARAGQAEAQQHHYIQRLGELTSRLPRFRVPHLCSMTILAGWDKEATLAIAYLEESPALAEQLGLRGEQWPILAELSRLYDDDAQIQEAKRQVAEIVSRLVEKIEDEGLRKGFVTAVTRLTLAG